jgi:hypothetical protein
VGSADRRSAQWRSGVLVVVGLVVGVALALGLPRLLDTVRDGSPASAAAPMSTTDTEAAVARIEDGVDRGPRLRSATPAEAVRAFLVAEAAGDPAVSYAHLSDEARAAYGSPTGWAADHVDVLPTVLDFTLEPATGEGSTGRAEVVADVRFEPGLDNVVGLTPGRARVEWVAVEEAGGWAVDVDAATLEPVHPDPAGAVDATREWVAQRQACPAGGALPSAEFEGGLFGERARAEALCGAAGAVQLGAPTPLSDLDARPFLAVYGADVTSWAHTVPVTAPVPLRAVLAPLGDEWQVVGVLGPRAG